MKRIEDFFLTQYNPLETKEYLLVKLQIKFSIISTLFALGYWVSTFLTHFIVSRYLMIVVSVLFTAQLFGLKAGISLRSTSRVFVLICWSVVIILTLFSGGIRSYVLGWIALIPIMALLLINHRAAWMWSIMGLLTVIFFQLADQKIDLPPQLIVPTENFLISSLHIGLLFIILTLTYIFDQQQTTLMATISELYNKTVASQEEIASQNEELIQSQEEILAQRDLLSDQNSKIEEARTIIEKQHTEIKLRNENLEAEVEKRTRELLEYNQQLEQFAFISSHNLRAPVARILGLGQLLDLPNRTPDDEKLIQTNLIATTRELDRVVKDLNTILEIKKNTEVLTKVDLQEELKLVRINLEKEIMETGAEIRSDFSAVNQLNTIRPYIDSILMNLISNAIKYRHPKRSPLIKLTTSLQEDLICLTVTDNGIGLDLALHKDKLFSLYSRFHTYVEGKGLGLYLVKTQVITMGGKIEVESTTGNGLTLRIYLKHNNTLLHQL